MPRDVTTDLGSSEGCDVDPTDALVGCLDGSYGDESAEHDHYLYGWSRESDAPRPP
jgi:hypothetical protein